MYCKLPTNSKQLPAFPLEAVPGIEPRPQRWEARVLPLCHRGPRSWFIEFSLKFNGKVIFALTRPHHELFVDTSLTGVGAIWENNVYGASCHMAATAQLSISQLEMLNVLISLRLFAAAWQHKSVCVHIDNKAAVFSLQRGKIKNEFMQSIARSVWLVAASYDISLSFEHVPGSSNNKADMLSRLFQSVNSFKNVQQFKDCVCWTIDGYTCSTQMSWCMCAFCCIFRFTSGQTYITGLPQNSSCPQTSHSFCLHFKV